MKANERQVGGKHYERKFQHWDLMSLGRAGYFAGQVTKYSERHSKKNGEEDLQKALHFAQKWNEVGGSKPLSAWRIGRLNLRAAIQEYAVDAGLTALQERIFEYCLLEPHRPEKVVELCRMHLDREYLSKRRADEDAVHEEYVRKRLSEAQQFTTVFPTDFIKPGSPEDGGHHAMDEMVDELESAMNWSADLEDLKYQGSGHVLDLESPELVIPLGDRKIHDPRTSHGAESVGKDAEPDRTDGAVPAGE